MKKPVINDTIQAQPATAMEQTRDKISANQELMKLVFKITSESFEALYGEKPEEDSDIWKFYLSEVFQTNLRVAITQKTQKK